MRFRNTAAWALRVVLGGVFIYAGAVKAGDTTGFAEEIEGYRLIAGVVLALVAVYLPWLEIVVGVALFTPGLARGALALVVLLLTVFLFALSSAAWRGLDISCGCLGASAASSGGLYTAMIRNVILLGMAGWVWKRACGRR